MMEPLTPELRARSISNSEPVFTLADAHKALDEYERAGVVILGWEPWILHLDGTHSHPIEGGDYGRPTSASETASRCRQEISAHVTHAIMGPGDVMHFCLTPDVNAHTSRLAPA